MRTLFSLLLAAVVAGCAADASAPPGSQELGRAPEGSQELYKGLYEDFYDCWPGLAGEFSVEILHDGLERALSEHDHIGTSHHGTLPGGIPIDVALGAPSVQLYNPNADSDPDHFSDDDVAVSASVEFPFVVRVRQGEGSDVLWRRLDTSLRTSVRAAIHEFTLVLHFEDPETDGAASPTVVVTENGANPLPGFLSGILENTPSATASVDELETAMQARLAEVLLQLDEVSMSLPQFDRPSAELTSKWLDTYLLVEPPYAVLVDGDSRYFGECQAWQPELRAAFLEGGGAFASVDPYWLWRDVFDAHHDGELPYSFSKRRLAFAWQGIWTDIPTDAAFHQWSTTMEGWINQPPLEFGFHETFHASTEVPLSEWLHPSSTRRTNHFDLRARGRIDVDLEEDDDGRPRVQFANPRYDLELINARWKVGLECWYREDCEEWDSGEYTEAQLAQWNEWLLLDEDSVANLQEDDLIAYGDAPTFLGQIQAARDSIVGSIGHHLPDSAQEITDRLNSGLYFVDAMDSADEHDPATTISWFVERRTIEAVMWRPPPTGEPIEVPLPDWTDGEPARPYVYIDHNVRWNADGTATVILDWWWHADWSGAGLSYSTLVIDGAVNHLPLPHLEIETDGTGTHTFQINAEFQFLDGTAVTDSATTTVTLGTAIDNPSGTIREPASR